MSRGGVGGRGVGVLFTLVFNSSNQLNFVACALFSKDQLIYGRKKGIFVWIQDRSLDKPTINKTNGLIW